jgi:hypothetical protein
MTPTTNAAMTPMTMKMTFLELDFGGGGNPGGC